MRPHALFGLLPGLTDTHRPLRLRLWSPAGPLDAPLLVKRVAGSEAMMADAGLHYRLLCVSPDAHLRLTDFLGAPLELQFVTDRGELRRVCGIVEQAAAGQSDGSLATYQLTLRDAFAALDQRVNSRLFRRCSEIDVTRQVLDEWRQHNPVLARCLDLDLASLRRTYPQRELIMQRNESDGAFLRRLWKRRGIAWFFRASPARHDAPPAHALVLLDDAYLLPESPAGTLRYHRDAATEARDSITAWRSARTLAPGRLARHSWDYQPGRMSIESGPTGIDQGPQGNALAAGIEDYLVDAPHAGDSFDDYAQLSRLRSARHAYEAETHAGESGVRQMGVGEWHAVAGHPELDRQRPEQRQFLTTALQVQADNNLPKAIEERIERLFAASGWEAPAPWRAQDMAGTSELRYRNRFTCVRRAVRVVPAFDPRTDLPRADPTTVIIAGPPGEEVHCDALGRVKVRFPECRANGAADPEPDSAWIRVGTALAGAHFGLSALPRAGMEALVMFLHGDVDKPVIVQLLHGGPTPPPRFNGISRLPAERYLCGLVSKEIRGARYNQFGLPVKNRRYTITLDDGQTIEGSTDELGRTSLMQSELIGDVGIVIAPDDSASE